MHYDPVSRDYILDCQLDGQTYRIAYEPRTKFTPRVSTQVGFDPESGLYTYAYTVSNLAGPQEIDFFAFNDLVEVLNSNQPDNWTKLRLPSPLYPFGRWHINGPGSPIAPGEAKTFSVQTLAPPGIVEGRLSGSLLFHNTIPKGFNLPWQMENAILTVTASKEYNYIQFHLPGPVPVPDVSGSAQAERFTALLKQAEELKWIDPETAQTLSAEFEPVKAALLGRGESGKASQTMLEQLETLKNQDKLNNKSYQLFKGSLLFFTRKTKGSSQAVPRYPSEAESCRARMKFLGCQVEGYYLNHDRFPPGLLVLGFPACCPIDGSAYTYQWCTLPWGYTVTCPACHDGGRAGEVQYSSSQKPAPTVDLANPGGENE